MDPLVLIFWVIICATIGGLIGASRNNVGSGVIWGALLGPIGWLLVFFLDNRDKCPQCQGPLPTGAKRCQHCGVELKNTRACLPPIPTSGGPVKIPVVQEEKKCPFCAELIKKEAIKCRFCGSDLVDLPGKKEQEISGAPAQEHKQPAEPAKFADSPCPLCALNIRGQYLKLGENYCPHCLGKFIVE